MLNQSPRVVMVVRKTPLQMLLERHGTRGQAEFYLKSRGQDISDYVENHDRFLATVAEAEAGIPPAQRRTRVEREELDRFVFSPDDIILAVGQDGLVPNVAKYLTGQIVFGVNSDPGRYDGILCRGRSSQIPAFLEWTATRSGETFAFQRRTMVEAGREDGQIVRGLNEVFVGHRSHQSARYTIRTGRATETQSSSGLICSTGTGCTGWTRSIVEQRRVEDIALPSPEDRRLAWFVREPFPSVSTGTSLDHGVLEEKSTLVLESAMADGGVVFADGMESDFVDFSAGQVLHITLARHALQLAVPFRIRG